MKKIIFILITILLTQTSLAQFEDFDKATSTKELISMLEDQANGLEYFITFFNNKNDEPSKLRKVNALKHTFNQSKSDNEIEEKSNYNYTFINDFKNGEIVVYIYKDENVYGSLDDLGASIYPTKIHYHDGTTEIPTKKINLSTRFSNELNLKKAVKQIDIEMIFSAARKLDSIVIPVKNNLKTKKKGFDFEIIKQNNQEITIKTNVTDIDFIEIQAIAANNDRIESQGKTKLTVAPEYFESVSNKLLKQLNKLVETSKKDSLMDYGKFKTKFLSNLNELKKESEKIFNNDSNEVYITYTFGAPVKEIIFYYNDDIYERKIGNRILPKKIQPYLIDYEEDNQVFYDLNGKLITKIKDTDGYENDYFFSGINQYYYFDLNKKQMIGLPYYKIETFTNNFILAKEDDESPFYLIDNKNQKLIHVDGYHFDKDFNLGLIHSNNKFYIINNQSSEPFEIKNIDYLTYAEKGYFVAKKNNKVGFIDANGKIIVPIEYDDVQAFDDFVDLTSKDVLFGVKKNDKWGFVNAQNQTVIPFMYSDIQGPFSYGIAPVYIDGKLGLINLKNEKLTQFTGSSYGSSSNFGKRAMSLSDGYYNHLGEFEDR